MPVTIMSECYADMVKHALSDMTKEVCGLIIGVEANTYTNILRYIPCTNISDSPLAEFIIDPREQLAVYNSVTPELYVVGIFHSHPFNSHKPSWIDKINIRDNNFFWLIYGGVEEDIGCYRATIDRNGTKKFEQKALEIRDSIPT
jgi:proteasome lid subunit RPN8/RPN11